MNEENKKCEVCGINDADPSYGEPVCGSCIAKANRESIIGNDDAERNRAKTGSMQCDNCGKKANELFKYKDKSYCKECETQLEANGTAPWQDKCANCSKVVSLLTDISCPYCGNSLSSNLKKTTNNNSPQSSENQPQKTNYLPWILGGVGVVGLIGIVVYFINKKR